MLIHLGIVKKSVKMTFASLEKHKDKPIIVVCTCWPISASKVASQLAKAGFH